MDISPQRVRTAEFKTVKKGLDPDEVRSFLHEVAGELERAQNQSTAMEARARAAVARLQEISEATPPASVDATPAQAAPVVMEQAEVTPSVDQAETISRTLLLAQRTADTAIAEAEAEAARLRAEAEADAVKSIESAHEITERLTAEARDEARKQGEAARIQVESEVNALLARRDFLESDVDHLQTFLVDERARLREAATEIMELVERVPSGLGEVRRPLLSASDDEEAEVAATTPTSGAAVAHDVTEETSTVSQRLPSAATTDDATTDADAADADAVDADDGLDETSGEAADGDEELLDDAGRLVWGEGSEPAESGDVPERLIIQTDISDDGPTGFSYDKNR